MASSKKGAAAKKKSQLLIYLATIGAVLITAALITLGWKIIKEPSVDELLVQARNEFQQGSELQALVYITRGLKRAKDPEKRQALQKLRRKIIFERKLTVIGEMLKRGKNLGAKIQLAPLMKEEPNNPRVQLLNKAIEQALERKRRQREQQSPVPETL